MKKVIRTKCVIVGDSTVGKTSLTEMFLSDGTQFPKSYNMTFGVKLNAKSIAIPETNYSVEMLIYDSSGKDLYTDFLPYYWNEPNILMAVYDVTSQESLDSVTRWITLARSAMPQEDASSTPGVLFANKTDLTNRRILSPKVGEAMAEKLSLHYFEGSAKENQGIEEPFFLLAHEWHKYFLDKK